MTLHYTLSPTHSHTHDVTGERMDGQAEERTGLLPSGAVGNVETLKREGPAIILCH